MPFMPVGPAGRGDLAIGGLSLGSVEPRWLPKSKFDPVAERPGSGSAAPPRVLLETESEYNGPTRPGEAPVATASLVACLVERVIGMVVVLDWMDWML